MTYAGDGPKTALVVVKPQKSPQRGDIWRCCVFINGVRLIRPGFQKRKAAVKLAAMQVQQMLVHGWDVKWQVFNQKGERTNLNLAVLGSKMERGEKKEGQ
jgi:hypothetical protein